MLRFTLWFLLLAAGTNHSVAAPHPAQQVQVTSPGGLVQIEVTNAGGQLEFSILAQGRAAVQPSPMHLTMDGVDLAEGCSLGEITNYKIDENYPWNGVHSTATNHCNGCNIALLHQKSNTSFTLELRAFDDSAAFRFIVPGGTNARVPDEATLFEIPEGSTVWYHGLESHYEGLHVAKEISEIRTQEWTAPPVTFRLPNRGGYAAITEAALKDYSGMALQANGRGAFQIRLANQEPVSASFRSHYTAADVERLSKPARITGTIITPWRVVMWSADLNGLVNCDAVHNLAPPPDTKLFPDESKTSWIKPGRAVWRRLDEGGDNSLATMKEFTRLAHELGFEYHILEGFWSQWKVEDMKELLAYANQQHVGIWFSKDAKSLRDQQARRTFFSRCHDLGLAGAKIDFFDNEAKEFIDLYQALLKDAAEFHLLLDFHGANKPTGEARTWPNELTREAVMGMEADSVTDRATHGVTLPFTRFLSGPAEYAPLHLGDRRKNTTWAHQIASAAILSAPLLTYASNPSNILANPGRDFIKSIPPIWDETRVLPPSEIGQAAVFARRTGSTWFLAIMNGTTSRHLDIPLPFLGPDQYKARLLRDDKANPASIKGETTTLTQNDSVSVELSSGGGFIGRFTKN